MKIRRAHLRVSSIFVVLGTVLLSGCNVAGSGSQPQSVRSSTATLATSGGGAVNYTIVIPNNDVFAPYITVLTAGDTVTWLNEDTVLHTVLTAPTAQGDAVNPTQFQFVLDPGKAASLTLRKPGLYYYYCDAHAALPDGGPSVARSGVRAYPVPMDGFLYVRGPGISAISTQAVSLSTASRFTPWLTIIRPSGVVTWTNQTQRMIHVQGVPGYGLINPSPLAFQVAPGSSASVTFPTVGIYDYYATESAKLDPVWLRPAALPGAVGYPVPMEGIVAVFP